MYLSAYISDITGMIENSGGHAGLHDVQTQCDSAVGESDYECLQLRLALGGDRGASDCAWRWEDFGAPLAAHGAGRGFRLSAVKCSSWRERRGFAPCPGRDGSGVLLSAESLCGFSHVLPSAV